MSDKQIVQTTTLPAGWRNVYKHGRMGVEYEACPAVLLLRDPETGETEVQFAGRDHGRIVPVADVTNYVTTIGPGEQYPPKPGTQYKGKLGYTE